MASDDASPRGATTAAAGKNLLAIRPFFIVDDLQRSIAYYVDRLGFQLDFQAPPDDVYYAQVSRDDVAIMLKTIVPAVQPVPNHTRHVWARWDAYVVTLDPDRLFDELKQRGASFVKELSIIDDGLWGFEVRDGDGYVLAFFRTAGQNDGRPVSDRAYSGRPDPARGQPAEGHEQHAEDLVPDPERTGAGPRPTRRTAAPGRAGASDGGVMQPLSTDDRC